MKKPKQSNNRANRTRTYSFRFDDLFEPRNGSLEILKVTINTDIWTLLTEVIVILCAYEYVEHDRGYQKLFNELVGEKVTKPKVQRWLLGALVYKLQLCITINLSSRLEADATTGDFASELTRAIKPEDPEHIYKESIERLFRELVSIARQNRPALLDKVTKHQQIAYNSISIITPFRLSAMLIGLLSNGFIAALSQPTDPKLVELVERSFLPSLKQALLPTRSPGDTRSSDPWAGRLPEFKRAVDDWYHVIEQIRNFSIKYKRKPWEKWIKEDEDYKRYCKGRNKRWLKEVMRLISTLMEQQAEAVKSRNQARLRRCRQALGTLGLTCDLAARMLNPPIKKPGGEFYGTETTIRYYRKAGGTLGTRSSSRHKKSN